jgi:hypothetical protein
VSVASVVAGLDRQLILAMCHAAGLWAADGCH